MAFAAFPAFLAFFAAFRAPGALLGWGPPWDTGTGLDPMCMQASIGQTSGKRREMWRALALMACCMDAMALVDMKPCAGSCVGSPVCEGGCIGPGVCWLSGDSEACPASR